MNRRPLTEEEKQLWDYVTRGDVPLHSSSSPLEGEQLSASPKDEVQSVGGGSAILGRPPTAQPAPLRARLRSLSLKGGVEVASGVYAGIDRNTAERFRKGKYPIDARLDLHGMTREKAQGALGAFIRSHHERQSRCLLVITGKGRKDAPGVLRDLLPHWLADSELKPLVLAFDMAQPKHGGTGAYYILLRRKR